MQGLSRPACGHSKDGRDDLKQVLLSLGMSSDGLPLRMGLRDGHTRDSTETPVAIEECVALGLDGVHGIVLYSFTLSRSEYVFGCPWGRLSGSGGQGNRSTSCTRLTRILVYRNISEPPSYRCVVTEILRGQPCCGQAEHGCLYL